PFAVCQCSKPKDAMMQMKERMPVRSTIVTEMPSTPRKYSMLKVEIQGCCSLNWYPSFGWKRIATTMDATIARNDATAEIPFVADFGASTTSRAPAIGIQIVRDNRCSYIAELPNSSLILARSGSRVRYRQNNAITNSPPTRANVRYSLMLPVWARRTLRER